MFWCPTALRKGTADAELAGIGGKELHSGWNTNKEKNQHWSQFRVVVGEGTAFPGTRQITLSDIHDGPKNTIFAVECKKPVDWMNPHHEMTLETALLGVNKTEEGIGSFHSGGAHVLMGNGEVRFLPDSTTPEELRHLLLIDDGK